MTAVASQPRSAAIEQEIARSLPDLTAAEMTRYGRHFSLAEIGVDGQRKLKAGSVLIVGAGGLGSPAALYLAAAGVGRIGIVDFDAVDGSNLQRQILYEESDVGRPKTAAARERLLALNPHIAIEVHEVRLGADNALQILERYDVVADGTDNFAARYLVNDACVMLGKPNAFGSVLRFEGQASVFAAVGGPCYRCLFREPPPPGAVPTCAEAGVMGVLPGIIGSIQATEVIKLITGIGEPLVGRLLLFDALAMKFREVEVRRDPGCPSCGTNRSTELVEYAVGCGPAEAPVEISVEELSERMRAGTAPTLVDVRDAWEWQIARLPGATHVPLSQLPGGVSPTDGEVVLYCHHGVRSRRAAEILRDAGVPRAVSLAGGIDRWSVDVDPSVPRY